MSVFDDKDMKFNAELEQYVLDKDYVLNNIYLDEHIEVELRSNKRLNMLLREVSDDVYRYIYRHTYKPSIHAKRYLLENSLNVRNILKRAMLAQVRYYLRSGGGLLKDMIGVDLERSRLINIDALRGERSMSPHAIDFLYEDEYILYSGHISLIEVKNYVQHTSNT